MAPNGSRWLQTAPDGSGRQLVFETAFKKKYFSVCQHLHSNSLKYHHRLYNLRSVDSEGTWRLQMALNSSRRLRTAFKKCVCVSQHLHSNGLKYYHRLYNLRSVDSKGCGWLQMDPDGSRQLRTAPDSSGRQLVWPSYTAGSVIHFSSSWISHQSGEKETCLQFGKKQTQD